MSDLRATLNSINTEGTDTAIISWTPPADASQVDKYIVKWTPSLDNSSASVDAGKLNSVKPGGFTPGRTYTFSIESQESGSRDIVQNVQSNAVLKTMSEYIYSFRCVYDFNVTYCIFIRIVTIINRLYL